VYGYTLGRVLGEFGGVASEEDESGRGIGEESEKVFEDQGAELAGGAGEDDLGCVLEISACCACSWGCLTAILARRMTVRGGEHSRTS
jgi:hypothetical protein